MIRTVAPLLLGLFLLTATRSASAAGADPGTLLEEAQAALMERRHEEALAKATRAKALAPDNPVAYLLTGAALFVGKRFDAAAKEWRASMSRARGEERRALAQTIGTFTGTFWTAEEKRLWQEAHQAIERRRPDVALARTKEGLALNPNNTRLLYERGYALVESKKLKEAAVPFEAARKLNPWDPAVLEELTVCYRELGDYPRMQGVIEDRLVLDPESVELQGRLGWVLAVQHRPDAALAVLDKVLAQHPDYTPAHFTAGQVHAERKDPRRARASFQRFIELAERELATGKRTGLSDLELKAYLSRARTELGGLKDQ